MNERRTSKDEILKELKRLAANYPFFKIDTDKVALWDEMLNRFDPVTITKAVTDWMAHNSKEPTTADIIEQINAAATRKTMGRRYRFEDPNQKTVRCWKCQDKGCMTVIYPTGVEALRFCDCSAGNRYGRPYKEDQERKIDDFESKYLFGVGLPTFKAGKVTEERMVDDKNFEVYIKLHFVPSKTIVELPNRSNAPSCYKERIMEE